MGFCGDFQHDIHGVHGFSKNVQIELENPKANMYKLNWKTQNIECTSHMPFWENPKWTYDICLENLFSPKKMRHFAWGKFFMGSGKNVQIELENFQRKQWVFWTRMYKLNWKISTSC